MASTTTIVTRAVLQPSVPQGARASFRRGGHLGGGSSSPASTCRSAAPLIGGRPAARRLMRVQRQKCDTSSSPRAQRRNTIMLDPYAFYRTPVSDLANRMFEEFVGCQQQQQQSSLMAGGKQSPRSVPVDVLERETEYVVWAELPGCDEGDVSVQLEGRILTVSAGPPPTVADYLREGSKEGDDDEKSNETVLMAERGQRAFSRAFRLPKDVNESGIHATMDKGVLTLVLPRVQPERPTVRTIPIMKSKNSVSSTDDKATLKEGASSEEEPNERDSS